MYSEDLLCPDVCLRFEDKTKKETDEHIQLVNLFLLLLDQTNVTKKNRLYLFLDKGDLMTI